MTGTPVSVDVCIASIGRGLLLDTIRSISDVPHPTLAVRILVADDSLDGKAKALVEAHGPWPIRVEVRPVAKRNIALARNATLEMATAEFIAFIDDDERADPDWLENLHAVLAETGADVVFGPVDADYPPGAPAWLNRAGPFRKRPGPRGQPIWMGATSNAMARRAALTSRGITFREEFGKTGGEDSDLFHRLHRQGARLVTTDDAFVRESVPPERLQMGHLQRRYTRGGHTYARVMLDGEPLKAKVAYYGTALTKIAIMACVWTATRLPRHDIAFEQTLRIWFYLGGLAYGLGRPNRDMY